jgi:hypothetical protein
LKRLIKQIDIDKRLQKFFSGFPGGAAGLGLLLLPATLSIKVIIQGWFCLLEQENSTIWKKSFGLAAKIISAALLLGCLTPLCSFLIFLGSA